ncbi:MAG: hypothetical protein QM644_07200 [Mobilitalea sp.]
MNWKRETLLLRGKQLIRERRDLMKILKILYLLFWSVCMFIVDVSIVVSEIKIHQKIAYIILILIAYITVLHLFKGKNDIRKKE